MHHKRTILFSFILFFVCVFVINAQQIPSPEENIPFLVTFGKDSKSSWGDDDFCQIFFFIIPKEQKKPVFIRVYDPEIGGSYDEIKEKVDSKTKFSVYGGNGAFTNHDAVIEQPIGHYNSGTLLSTKTFGLQPQFDQQWYSFGPINPVEGEYMEEYGGYIIKFIVEGITGNDGNLYKFFISSDAQTNQKIEGSNMLTYEYTFRLPDAIKSVSHIYPYIGKDVVSIKIHTFDFDNDGVVRIISVSKMAETVVVSGDNHWTESLHKITDAEKNTSLDIQMIKRVTSKDNNVVFFITNQYGTLLPFFTSPIGGVPKHKVDIGARQKTDYEK